MDLDFYFTKYRISFCGLCKPPLCKRRWRKSVNFIRLPCAKGAPAQRVRDCPTIILQDTQIGSMYRQFLRLAFGEPPPFAQRRLLKFGGAFGGLLLFAGGRLKLLGSRQSLSRYRDSSLCTREPFCWSRAILFRFFLHKCALTMLTKYDKITAGQGPINKIEYRIMKIRFEKL